MSLWQYVFIGLAAVAAGMVNALAGERLARARVTQQIKRAWRTTRSLQAATERRLGSRADG